MLIIYRLKLISEELLDTSNLFKNSMYVEGWKYGKLRAGKSLENHPVVTLMQLSFEAFQPICYSLFCLLPRQSVSSQCPPKRSPASK